MVPQVRRWVMSSAVRDPRWMTGIVALASTELTMFAGGASVQLPPVRGPGVHCRRVLLPCRGWCRSGIECHGGPGISPYCAYVYIVYAAPSVVGCIM